MQKKIILATNNSGKMSEFSHLLAPLNWQVLSQSEFNIESADETGLTFVENAIIKARHACKHAGLPALADDSGLEVDFLNGAPGIYSARYAGETANNQHNIDKLLTELEFAPTDKRSARFQCVLVMMRHEYDPTPLICQGTWEGHILTERQGERGFGYDPVFFVPEKNCSAAQLSADEKSNLSHRGKALRLLLSALG